MTPFIIISSSSSNSNRPQENVTKISRRRRSMQAITKIVETTEFPYDDRHFWKNNGNTVQKKTGCKSVYYKCANSCKVSISTKRIGQNRIPMAFFPTC